MRLQLASPLSSSGRAGPRKLRCSWTVAGGFSVHNASRRKLFVEEDSCLLFLTCLEASVAKSTWGPSKSKIFWSTTLAGKSVAGHGGANYEGSTPYAKASPPGKHLRKGPPATLEIQFPAVLQKSASLFLHTCTPAESSGTMHRQVHGPGP